MPIPETDSAWIPTAKLTDYLLDEQHPVGGSKARWFRAIGYDPENPEVLERDLLQLVRTSEDYSATSSRFGTKYVVSGNVTAPNAKEVNLTTVWIVESSDNRPRLVTAYPGDER